MLLQDQSKHVEQYPFKIIGSKNYNKSYKKDDNIINIIMGSGTSR